MNMAEALEWAADYATRNKLFDAPLNQRGYVTDGWKHPTPAEKAEIIKSLAYAALDEGSPKALLEKYQKREKDILSIANYLEGLYAEGEIAHEQACSIIRILTGV